MPLLTIAVMLVLHLPNTAAQRDTRSWYQAYEEGRLAVGKNDTAAIASLEKAKREGPKPGRKVNTYGDTYIDFNPDYHLGVAYLNVKRFVDADAAFKRVQQAQLITAKDKDYTAFTRQVSKATFELGLDSAEKALAGKQFDQALEAARQASKIRGISVADLGRAGELTTRIEKEMATPNPPATPTPTPSDPKNTPATTPTPTPSAYSTPTPTPTPNVTPTANVTPTPSLTPRPSPTPSTGPTKGPRPVPQTAPTAVSAAELAGMTLFFKGEYGSAGDQLRTVTDGKSPTARAYFYLACAKVGLVLSGGADAELIQEAKALFKSAGGDSSVFSADRRYISPRILQMLGGNQ